MTLPEQGRRIIWLIRFLAIMGVAMVVIYTGLVWWTLARVREERLEVLTTQDSLSRAADDLRQYAADSRTELQLALDETAPGSNDHSALANFIRAIKLYSTSHPDPGVSPALNRLDRLASRLDDVSRVAYAWRTNYLIVWEDLRQERSMNKVRDLIAQSRRAIESLEGRRRLDEAIRYRQWRNSTNEDAAARARAILVEQGRQQNRDTADFKSQLSEFARLVELLGGEEQFDSLADLKDNRLKPVLDRLNRSIAILSSADDSDALTPQAVENLRVALFGEGYLIDEAHQNIQPGRDGLFTLRRDALQLRRERERLKGELSVVFQKIESANNAFGQSADMLTAGLTRQMQRNLEAGLSQMMVLGSGCVALFVGLGWFIARGVKGQVHALEQSRAEAERARQTTQELMLQQQAAAAKLAEAHKELQASERRQELIFNSIGEGIHWIDRDGRIKFGNPAAARMLGWPASELLGRYLHSTLQHTRADGSLYPQSESPILSGLQSGEVQRVNDELFWRQNGTSFPAEYTSTPVRDPDGQIMGVVVVFTDISQRKQAEAELERVHRQLLETSRTAGMAEVATSVLHNVGNVLNSVNVTSQLMKTKLEGSKVSSLEKAMALMQEHTADLGVFLTTDEKGKNLPAFLGKLTAVLVAERDAQLADLDHLNQNIDHIKQIVAMQQSYAKVCGVVELQSIPALVEDALRMHVGGLTRHQVRVVREFDEVPETMVDKHKVLQILVNLISNAKYALSASAAKERVLSLSVRMNSDDLIHVSVTDNGVGIEPDNLTRIFAHGFTTKKDGHGFGLHSGALAAREMGGSLFVTSEGLGRGATFILALPHVKGAPTNDI